MITISITNNSGGIGKTTIAQNLSDALSKRGKRVLLIDFDGKASLTSRCGLKEGSNVPTIASYLAQSGLPITPLRLSSGTYLIPGDSAIDKQGMLIAKELTSGIPARIKQGLHVLNNFLQRIPCGNYDYCIIDGPNNGGSLMYNTLLASDYLIIPINDEDAVTSARSLAKMAREIDCQLRGKYLLSMIRERTAQYRELRGLLASDLRDNTFHTVISSSLCYNTSSRNHSSIFSYHPGGLLEQNLSGVRETFLKLADEVIDSFQEV